MTIGETLKSFRLNQGKSKKDWVGNIVTASYYGKIESNLHQIRMDVFLELLEYNHISTIEFFNKYDQDAKTTHDLEREISFQLNIAYYHNSEAEVRQVMHMIEKSTLSAEAKQKRLIWAKVYLADIKNDFSNLSNEEEKELKEQLFAIDQFDLSSLHLYCNAMGFYNLDDNILLATRIIKQLITNNDFNIQETLIGMIANLIIICIEEKRYDDALPFIKIAEQISTEPRIFFQKNVLLVLKNMINYHYQPKSEYLTNCKRAIENFSLLGMAEYGQELEKFYSENI